MYSALVAAVEHFDKPEAVGLLLADGVDPIARNEHGETALEFACSSRWPHAADKYNLIRENALPLVAATPSLSVEPSEDAQNPLWARGIGMFLDQPCPRGEYRWEIAVAKCDYRTFARSVAESERFELHEAAEDTPVRLEPHQYAVFGLEGQPWSILFSRVGYRSWRSVAHLMNACHVLSGELLTRAVVSLGMTAVAYDRGWLFYDHNWPWNSATQREQDCAGHVGLDTDKGDKDLEAIVLKRMDEWFVRQGIFLPRMRWQTDGVYARLVVTGVSKEHVVGAAIVDAEKLIGTRG